MVKLYPILGLCSLQIVSAIIWIPDQFPDDYEVGIWILYWCYEPILSGQVTQDAAANGCTLCLPHNYSVHSLVVVL